MSAALSRSVPRLANSGRGLGDIATDLKTDKIRDNFTPSLGKDHGRALLKAKKPLFEQRLTELRTKLKEFQAKIKEDLQKQLDASREAVVKYYIPRIIEHPPDSLSGQLLTDKRTSCR